MYIVASEFQACVYAHQMQRRNAQNSTKNRYINGVPKTTAQRQTSIKSTPAKQTFIAKTKNKTEYSKRYNKNIKTLEEILQEINNHSLPSKTPYHTSPFLRHRLGPGMNWWSCEADCAAPFAQTISPWRLKALASLLVRWWVGKQEVARNLDIFFLPTCQWSLFTFAWCTHTMPETLFGSDRLTTPEADEHARCRYCLYVSWPGSLLLARCKRGRSG